MNKSDLCKMATDALKNAYAPYSHCNVGAVLFCDSGEVYTGCNVENASFSATCCAERVALYNAISNGERGFCALAVATVGDGVNGEFVPCGVCRQVLSEFCPENMPVYVSNGTTIKEYTLAELLPHNFGKSAIKGI